MEKRLTRGAFFMCIIFLTLFFQKKYDHDATISKVASSMLIETVAKAAAPTKTNYKRESNFAT